MLQNRFCKRVGMAHLNLQGNRIRIVLSVGFRENRSELTESIAHMKRMREVMRWNTNISEASIPIVGPARAFQVPASLSV